MVKAPPSPPSFPQTAGPPGAVVGGGGHPGLDISEVLRPGFLFGASLGHSQQVSAGEMASSRQQQVL